MKRMLLVMVLAGLGLNQPLRAGGLTPEMSGLTFLVGQWTSPRGTVADTGGTSTGRSTFTIEASGAVLLRRDHTDLFDAGGKPAGGLDQIMIIYAEGNTLRADYADGQHVIHYRSADVQPGHAVVFTSDRVPAAPTFRLNYVLTGPDTLAITFEAAAPGSSQFHPIASGTATRAH